MPIEREDWIYLGGAAAGGIVLGALMKSLLSRDPEPVHTGLARTWSPKGGGADVTTMIWAIPGSGYFPTFTNPDGKGAFPDMPNEAFTSPFTAAMWADGVMQDLDYSTDSDWAPMVNEASKARRKERKLAISSRRPS